MGRAWRDALWGYHNMHNRQAQAPSAAAALWRLLGCRYPEELEEFLDTYDML
jgi:hypothetical protein